jgi:hypothetical protein
LRTIAIGVSPADARLQRALSWLEASQSGWNGRWVAASPNRLHWWPGDETRHFMDDAATAFAVLALAQARSPARPD